MGSMTVVRRSAQPRDALVAFLEPTKKAEQEIIFTLERAASDAERAVKRLLKRGGFSDRVRAEQQRQVQLALHVRLRKLYEDVGLITLAQRSAAITRTLEVQRQLVNLEGFNESSASEARQAVERFMLTARYARHPLSRQVYLTASLANGQVDRLVNRAIAQGYSVDELARSVEQFIHPDVRGGASYAARRLARTELATAAHAATVWHAQNTPEIGAVRWNLSGSHPSPDICDARVGEYTPFKVPGRAHPNCMCYLTPVPADITEDQFIDDLLAELESEFPTAGGEEVVEAVTPGPTRAEPYRVPSMAEVGAGEHAARLTDDPTLRRELDLQEAITPNSASQLFEVELVESLGASTGGVHNRALRRIQIATGNRDGLEGRDIYNKAERGGFHPSCGKEHTTAQLHLAHEYGHHVHQMLDFMPIDDREDLRDLIADQLGVPRPPRADRNHPLFNPEHLELLTYWMSDHRTTIEYQFGRYAGKNEREMLAEIWSAYSTNPDTQNEPIKVIGARMRELAEAGAKRGKVDRPDEDAKRMEALADKIKKAMEQGLL